MTMMRVKGGPSFERQFYRSGSFAHDVMMKVCNDVVDEALREKMVCTMEDKLKRKIEYEKLDQLIKHIANDDLPSIDESLNSVSLDVTFDMGWQKRAGGRVYDSLSGHGFYWTKNC